jgi:hypothetical protein
MSTGTTQLVAADLDNSVSSLSNIGFTFNLMGNPYTQFYATSNGIVQLGATAPSSALYVLSGGSTASPRIGALAADLRTGTAGKVHYKVVGTAPNRCLVVEFLNMSITYVASPGSNDGTYQVRLYETSGVIEYVYGPMFKNASSTTAAAIYSGFSVNTTANTLASITTSSNTVSTGATFNVNSYTNSTNIPNLHSPTEGSRRYYRFTPPVPSAPTSLTFSTVGAFGMTLNWVDNASNEIGYQIYRSLDGVTYTLVNTTAANSTSYVATSLANNTLYYWKVLAITEGTVSTPDLLGSQMTLSSGTLTGIKTVGSGGDYDNLTTAFNAINVQGLAGDVELQLIAGYPATPETYPIQSSNTAATGAFNIKVYPTVSGLSITSSNTTGTLNLNNAKNLTFDGRVNQTGANDLIIANTNVGSSYAILFNNDAQNNFIKNTFVQSTNNSTTSGTIVFGTTTGTNGNDNNTIDNCDIRDGVSTPFNGIYASGSTGTAAQFNDNNTITNNRISNYYSAGSSSNGVFVGSGNSTWTISNNKLFQTATRTSTAGSTHNGIQISNTNGNGFIVSGNIIGFANASGTGVTTYTGGFANRYVGISLSVGTTATSSVQGNTISGINLSTTSGAGTGAGILAGISITSGNVNVGNTTPNIIGATTGIDAIVGTSSTTAGLIVGINSSSSGTVNISNNQIGALTGIGSTATISTCITGIQVSAGTPTINGNTIGSTVTANSINSSTVSTAGSQLVRGIDVTSGVTSATSIQSNTVSNLNQNSTATGASIRGISYAGTGLANISSNTVSLISGASSNTSAAGAGVAVQGILHTGTATGGAVVSNNTVHSLYATNTGTVQTNVVGIGYSNPTTGNITANKIYNLRNSSTMATATTPPTAAGVLIRALVTSVIVSNNMISLGDAQTTNTEFIGIWNSFTTTGTINLFNNSISISGTAGSGALNSFGILRGDNSGTAITTPVDIRNNLISNIRTGGTGKHYAIANQSTVPSTTGWGTGASNYNVLNATAATVGLWGSTDATFNAWRVASSGDLNSYSAIPVTFVNVTTGDLHLNMGVTPTPIESGGTTIASVTTDFDLQARPGPAGSVNGGAIAPDLGADEFDGAPALPVITLNSVTPPTTTQCTATARLVSVNVTTPVGTITTVNLSYTVNGVAQTPITMTNTSGTTWEGTIPAPTPANATIAWAVSATNSSGLTKTYTGTPYADEPLFGYTATASASNTTVCSGFATNLTAKNSKNGTVSIGAGSSVTSGSGGSGGNYVSPFSHYFGGYKAQYVIRASELTSAGLSAGNMTSVAFDVTSAGITYNSFSMSLANTAATVANATFLTGTFTNVYSGNLTVGSVGLNTITFSTPFNWDGTSNILVELCWSNNNTGGTAAEVRYDATSFVSQAYYRADSQTPATICGTTTATGTQSNRPKMVFTGVLSLPITSVTWMDGATTVGTGNPLTVNPTTTTTYTANITSVGCVFSPAPTTTVTVNPLPSAPTATNSAQCGTQVPTASVASTSGLPTPTFVWYSASTGGTVMQSSTSTTYTSNVASTTTFYVAELNTATGCESARTPITVTVAAADGILASINNATICIGGSVNLSVVNTNGTPNQNYTYTWTNAQTGSGLTSQGGANITVTPTQAGTYTYDVSGVDGGCNAVSSVNLTVNPFTVVITPVNITCNGYNNGSFTLGATTCGTSDVVSVDGGAFGPIPTNLTPGVHAVVVRNTAGYTSASQNITITEPSTVIGTPTGTNATVCQNGTTANVSANSAITPATTSASVVVSFTVATQPTENSATTVPTVAASPNVIATATMAALPAGATITSANLNYNGIQATGSSWMSDVRLGLTGAATLAYTGGTGSTNSAGTFNYTAPVTPASINVAGGSISLHYFDFYSDNAGSEATFPTGAGVANLTINYTIPNTSTISWWDAATGGTQIGTGSPLNAVGTSVLPNTTTPGTYTLYAQGNYSGCSSVNRTAVTVTVNALPTVNAGTDQTVCSGTSVTLAGSGATSYTWNNGITDNTAFTATATTTYTVTGTDGNGCQNTDQVVVNVNALPTVNAGADQTVCNGASVTLSGSGATSYSWNNGVSNATPFTATATTTYTVTGTDGNGCQNTDQVVVNVNALPTVSAGADQTVCSGTSVTLAGSGATSYSWDNGVTNNTAFTATATTTYTVTGTDGNGCTNTDQVVVNVNALPTVGAGSDQTVCFGTSVTLNGSGAVSYGWDNGVTDGTPFTATATTTYTVTGTDGNGCTNTDQVVVNVNALPAVNAGADQAACSGSSVTLTGTGTATGYAWDNGVTNGVAFTPSATMTYTVTGTDGNGCTNTDQVTVTVGNPTSGTDVQTACDSYTWIDGVTYTASNNTATFTLTNAAGCDSIVTLNLTITNSTTGTDVQTACDSYTWIDGVTYTASNNTATFTLTNAAGCDSIVTLNLTITNSTTGTDVQTACGSYTWIDGVTYTASNNTATFTLTNAAGCDSIVTLNLTITNSTTGTDVQTACGSYTWIDGITYTASNNTATFTLINAAGCDSIVTLNLTINALPNATATDNGDATITASAGTSYQWINCTSGLAIGGATSQTFAPTVNGSYAVVVTNAAGCSDTSSCVTINNVGVKEFSTEVISVYPNPTHNNVTITMTAAEATIVVVDGQGKTLKTVNVQNGEQLSLEEYATGVYFLNITTEFGTQLVKIAKH